MFLVPHTTMLLAPGCSASHLVSVQKSTLAVACKNLAREAIVRALRLASFHQPKPLNRWSNVQRQAPWEAIIDLSVVRKLAESDLAARPVLKVRNCASHLKIQDGTTRCALLHLPWGPHRLGKHQSLAKSRRDVAWGSLPVETSLTRMEDGE